MGGFGGTGGGGDKGDKVDKVEAAAATMVDEDEEEEDVVDVVEEFSPKAVAVGDGKGDEDEVVIFGIGKVGNEGNPLKNDCMFLTIFFEDERRLEEEWALVEEPSEELPVLRTVPLMFELEVE